MSSPFEDSLVGFSENHAVTAPCYGTTPNHLLLHHVRGLNSCGSPELRAKARASRSVRYVDGASDGLGKSSQFTGSLTPTCTPLRDSRERGTGVAKRFRAKGDRWGYGGTLR